MKQETKFLRLRTPVTLGVQCMIGDPEVRRELWRIYGDTENNTCLTPVPYYSES